MCVCVCDEDSVAMAARQSGYMWRVNAVTGQVEKTFQFKDEADKKLRLEGGRK